MDWNPDEPRTWWISLFGLVAGLLGMLAAWNARRLMTQHDGYGARIAALELQMAKKAEITDIGQVYEKLDNLDQRISGRLTVMSDRMAEQHVELLEAVYETKGRHA